MSLVGSFQNMITGLFGPGMCSRACAGDDRKDGTDFVKQGCDTCGEEEVFLIRRLFDDWLRLCSQRKFILNTVYLRLL